MKYVLMLAAILLIGFTSAFSQTVITGRVIDARDSTAALGVSVGVKGTNLGTTTDGNGAFRLSVPADAKTLVFSSAEFITREININPDRTDYSVMLERTSTALQEVVVSVAYGEQNRKKITGAVGKLQGNAVANIPMPTVEQMLQGKIAGLQSVSPSGQPGSFQQIRIRGIGSINASAEPLYVIDGVPVNSGDVSGLTNSSNLLATINANDIESISVLKDAASASIYGSRAANGVILITTKKGRAGKAVVRVDAEFGKNDIAFLPDAAVPLNREQFKELTTEGVLNIGGSPADAEDVLNSLGYNTTANYDWLDLVKRQGQQQQINASVSGGDAKTTFYLSGGYFKQMSVVIGSDFKRYSAQLSLKHNVDKHFSVGTNINISTFRQTGETESGFFRNPMLAAMALLPTQEAFNADGSPNYDPTVFYQIFNPLAIQQYDRQQNNTLKGLGSVFAEYKILPNLKLSSRYGVDYNNIEEIFYNNPFFGDAATADPGTSGAFYNNYTRLYNWVWTNLVDYNFKAWNDKLDGSVTAGYEAQKSKAYVQAANGTGVPQTTLLRYPSVATPISVGVSGSDYAFTSLLSKAQIGYLDKYILSGSIRRDGSSRFGSDTRYGTFWSVGAAWNVDQENFLQGIKFLSALKLRASYGVNGNAGIGNYDSRALYSFNGSYNGLPASVPGSVGNPGLTWEQNKPFDIGLEAGVFKNRVTVELDWYIRKTERLLLDEPLSQTSGFNSFKNNIGAMENKGFEITLNAIPVQTRNFTWQIGFNAAWNKNKITKLRDGVNEIINDPYIQQVGKDVQSIYTYLWAGANPETGDPEWYTDASKGSRTSDFGAAERAIYGSLSPKGFGGVNTSLTYKFVSLSAQLNYQYGNYVFDSWAFLFLGDGAFGSLNQYTKQLQRWQKPGDVTTVPRYDFFNSTGSNINSTRYFNKGDYLRLRNVTLSVDLPQNIISKLHLTKLSLYVRGTNLWTKAFDDQITIDPEQPINGTSDIQFYIPKSVTFGVNIQL
ncbi:SusC/RagA family TonB-linked outer membrane protein [Pollutibacter soli]|uniref:SusC/RagA family TonB-linked outer membrane protein n=1 Tax=Pollutibacter soli TaxID=3034157 RepID=UPI0030136C5A